MDLIPAIGSNDTPQKAVTYQFSIFYQTEKELTPSSNIAGQNFSVRRASKNQLVKAA